MNIVVIGGGIAGIATAIALEGIAGIEPIAIYEKSSRDEFYRQDAGAGAQLGPNGLRALRAIGGEDWMKSIMAMGTELKGNAIPAMNMTIPSNVDVDDESGLPQVLMRWGSLRNALQSKLQSKVVFCGDSICGYEEQQDQDGVKLILRDDDDQDGVSLPQETATLIVGADGAASICRHWVQSGNPTNIDLQMDNDDDLGLYDTGRVNIKAVLPYSLHNPDDPSTEFLEGYTYSHFASNGGVACFAGPAGEGYTYWAMSIADQHHPTQTSTTTATTKLPFLSNLDKNNDNYLQKVKEALLQVLISTNDDGCQFAIHLIQQTDASKIFVARSKAAKTIGPSLFSNDHRVVLVGDAAHAMSLSYGQNPNFALEGAAELAHAIAQNPHDIPAALRAYSERRVFRCQEMQRLSALRTERAMKQQQHNHPDNQQHDEEERDVSKWISEWDLKGSQ